jgi:AAA15 family ATPase/GTPase
MLLYTIEIKNYRSLEHVKLDNLQHFNVLIGRNNAGKSSVFLALSQLGLVLQGQFLPPEVLTDRDPGRALSRILCKIC